MKKILSVILSAVLVFSLLTMGVSAVEDTQYIWDKAQLLTSTEASRLSENATRLAAKYNMDVVILTVDSIGSATPKSYAENFYDSMGYADDGILLLLSMEERDWYICTTGRAMEIFTKKGIDRMGDEFVPYLSEGDYYTGFVTFLGLIPDYIRAFEEGTAVGEEFDFTGLLISLALGVIVALITVVIMRSGMNTAKQRRSATEYVKAGSFDLHQHMDFFLYSRVSKTAKSSSSSGSRSGGGRSHGGGGGKF